MKIFQFFLYLLFVLSKRLAPSSWIHQTEIHSIKIKRQFLPFWNIKIQGSIECVIHTRFKIPTRVSCSQMKFDLRFKILFLSMENNILLINSGIRFPFELIMFHSIQSIFVHPKFMINIIYIHWIFLLMKFPLAI